MINNVNQSIKITTEKLLENICTCHSEKKKNSGFSKI